MLLACTSVRYCEWYVCACMCVRAVACVYACACVCACVCVCSVVAYHDGISCVNTWFVGMFFEVLARVVTFIYGYM